MAFLHAHSCECVKSELDLFTLPPTQTTIEHSQWVQYKPLSSLTMDSPIEFTVSGTTEDYLDLAHTMLKLQVELINTATLSDAQKTHIATIGPINNLLHSLFSQVDVYLNQTLVSPPHNNYAYRAYIENLLNYDETAKNTHLGTVLWAADTAGHMDSFTNNEGLKKRRDLFFENKCDMIGHLHSDIFNQEKLLLNGVELRIRLVHSRDGFAIMDKTGACTYKITEASLFVRRVKISPGILIAHANSLTKTTAKYTITRVEVKNLVLHSGIQAESMDNVILGQLPKRIILGLVSNLAFNGNRTQNPYNFHNHGLNYLALYVDGVQVPSKALQPSFVNKKYVEAYHTLFSGTGIHFLNQGNSISRESYPNGYCLYVFDLTPDLSANNDTHFNLIRHGTVRVELRFDDTLSSTLNCIIYAEFDSVLEIDQSRQVSIDSTS